MIRNGATASRTPRRALGQRTSFGVGAIRISLSSAQLPVVPHTARKPCVKGSYSGAIDMSFVDGKGCVDGASDERSQRVGKEIPVGKQSTAVRKIQGHFDL